MSTESPTPAGRAGAILPILSVCLNPVIQKTLVFPRLERGEVNRSSRHRVDASGKGVNVARVLVESGRPCIHLTQAGGPTRDWFLAMCAADGLEVRAVDSGSEIRFCVTVVDEATGEVTELVEEARPVEEGTGSRILEAYDLLLPGSSAVVISGTKAAGFGPEIIPEMARRAQASGKPLILDVKGPDLLGSLRYRPLVVKPNLSEFLATWPVEAGLGQVGAAPAPKDFRSHIARVAAELYENYGSHLVLTRGREPTWFWDGADLAEAAVEPVRALNPTGSGDSFTAGLAALLAEGGTLRDAIRLGTRYGARNAERLKPGSISDTGA